MPTKPTTSITIGVASICEYFTAGPLSLAQQRTACANLAIRIDGRAGTSTLTGSGECIIRTDSPDERAAAVRYVASALRHLIGATLTLDVDTSGSIASLATLMEMARPRAGSQLSPLNRRRANLGLESALLELVTAFRLPVADSRHGTQIAETSPPTGDFANDRSSVLYLRSTGDLSQDRHTLNEMGRLQGTYILEVPQSVADDMLDDHVDAIAKLARRYPEAKVVLDCQTRVKDLDRIEALQAAADRSLTGRFTKRAGELLIMAGYGVRTQERLRELTKRKIRAIHLRTAHVGSLLDLHTLANQARIDKPQLFTVVSAPRGGSRLSGIPCQRAAAETESVDVFIPCLEPVAAPITDGEAGPAMAGAEPAPARIRYEQLVPIAGSYTYLSEADGTGTDAPRIYADEAHSLGLAHDALRSSLVQRSAIAHGFHTTRFSTTTFTASQGNGPRLLFGASARSPVSSHTAYVIADGHKGAAQALLERAGAPVPEGRIFAIADDGGAVAYAHDVGFPLVAKPASGTGGTGVTLNIKDDAQLRDAFQTIRRYPRYGSGDVLIQRHLPGDIYRIVVGDGRVLAAIRRRRPLVVGDGRRSIAELIISVNSPRRLNPRLRNAPITIEAAKAFLEPDARTLQDVPASGEEVLLGTNADGAMWGDSLDVSDELHPTIATAMVGAVEAIPGLRFCGVDVLIEDHRAPLHEQQVGICELNSCPELTTPEFPVYGTGSAAAHILFQGAARRYGILTAHSTSEPHVQLVASEVSDPRQYARWLETQAAARQIVAGTVRRSESQIDVDLAGNLVAVTSLCSLAIKGPRGVSVGRVETFPTGAEDQAAREVHA